MEYYLCGRRRNCRILYIVPCPYRPKRTLYSKKYGCDLLQYTHAPNTIVYSSNKQDGEPLQGVVTPIGSIVTAATALVNPYTKEGVESLCILPYTSVNVCVVNGQRLKFNAVNGQSPKISVVNGQNAEKSWSKF